MKSSLYLKKLLLRVQQEIIWNYAVNLQSCILSCASFWDTLKPPPFLFLFPSFFLFFVFFQGLWVKALHHSVQWLTCWSHINTRSTTVCAPYALTDEVRVQPSLACINSPCQEVAFDPNTQSLAQDMADAKCIHVTKGEVMFRDSTQQK